LRMVGGESPQSVFEQHMIAVRQKNINFYAETEITFDPQSYLQLAGIILYLDIMNYIYLYISYDEKMGRVVQIMKAAKDDFTILPIKMPIHGGKIKLCIAVKGVQGEFMIEDQGEKVLIAEENISFLSGGFTGNFIGLMVNDLEKKNHCMADFSYFTYQPSKNSSEK